MVDFWLFPFILVLCSFVWIRNDACEILSELRHHDYWELCDTEIIIGAGWGWEKNQKWFILETMIQLDLTFCALNGSSKKQINWSLAVLNLINVYTAPREKAQQKQQKGYTVISNVNVVPCGRKAE